MTRRGLVEGDGKAAHPTRMTRSTTPRNTIQPLLGPQELADWLGVPLATVYRWRTNGDGPPGLRVGKHLRYRVQDVESWLESQVERNGETA
jgi:excisionase family DNA binding protein